MNRREFLIGAAAGLAVFPARAATPFRGDMSPPLNDKAAFVEWMVKNRGGEEPQYLERRFDRYREVLAFHDLWTPAEKRAFLMTPRQEFVLPQDKEQAYVGHYLDIGFGVTITPPGTMGRMTSALQVRPGEKVLEIGTGSGYQSALLTYLTPRVYSIEIIPELASRTRGVYDRLIGEGYREYSDIATRSGDGYYGWAEAAPFDKIIVTCGIDHIPPPLLQQLKASGVMVIPIGPPGAQHILKVVKRTGADGAQSVSRSDVFGGKVIPFVPMTGGHQAS
ncbi:MAG TPA: protein-L-isoaspartate O-methyltransferase [Roseiarcus sp.]|jgi:protein-L-isoaspartate(D-aspartate) O-methyltransferase|nr:protein-L-isoaspartate O-methyltransferase [Roseiarcus sp.]